MNEMQNILRDATEQALKSLPMTIVDMLNQWFREHSQTDFAQELGINDATISRWKNGKAVPGFENCLRIAQTMQLDPIEVFNAIKSDKYASLYKSFFPKYSKPAPVAALTACPQHTDLHLLFEDILHGPEDLANGIEAAIRAIHEEHFNKKARRALNKILPG